MNLPKLPLHTIAESRITSALKNLLCIRLIFIIMGNAEDIFSDDASYDFFLAFRWQYLSFLGFHGINFSVQIVIHQFHYFQFSIIISFFPILFRSKTFFVNFIKMIKFSCIFIIYRKQRFIQLFIYNTFQTWR